MPTSRNDVARARAAWLKMRDGFERLAAGFDAFNAAAVKAGEAFRRALDPAVTFDRRKARRLARRFGGWFVVARVGRRRVYTLTGAAATRAIEAERGRGEW